MGRLPLYKDTFPDDLIKQMAEGKFDYEIFADWDISRNTFYRWLNEYPELREAYEIGFVKCHKWWTTEGKKRFAESNEKGFKYWIAIMNNKFNWGKEETGRNQGTTNINIQNMNVLDLKQKSPEQLREFIQSRLSENNLIQKTDASNLIQEIDVLKLTHNDTESK